MKTFCERAFVALCIFLIVHTTFALLEGQVPNPGGSELLPETKEFIKKLEKAVSLQDIKRLQEEDDTFMVHDFSEGLPKDSPDLKKASGRSNSDCKASAGEAARSSSQDSSKDVQTENNVKSSSDAAAAAHSVTNESTHEPDTDADNAQQEPAAPEASSTATGGKDGTAADGKDSTAAGGKDNAAADGKDGSAEDGGKQDSGGRGEQNHRNRGRRA